ncbi:MAG: aspartyl protease family protein [Edaphobacter sp.]
MTVARAQVANVAIGDVPIAQLKSEITKTTPGPLRNFFAGVLAAREGRDEEAIQLFTQALPSLRRTDPDQAALALRLLANVYDRDGLYAHSTPLYDELAKSNLLNRLTETDRQGAQDDAELARVLADSPAQTITRNGPVHLITSRENPLGVITTDITVNGVHSEWILDTGANESVISRSLASQLHLPILPGVAHTSGGVTGIENELHVALMPSLPLDGVTAHNVVLLVLDDANLTLSDGAGHSYHIAGIIGFPVLRALGRITFHHDGTLDATVDGGSASAGSPLELRFFNPVIEAMVEGKLLPFTLDTGASGTNLSVRFFDRFQAEEPTWKKVQTKNFGAGGETTSQSYLVPSVALGVGGRIVTLHKLAVAPAAQHADIDTLFGNVGEDLFQSVQSFTFDFPNMRFVMGPPLSAPNATGKH